jgi:hypothetical protein
MKPYKMTKDQAIAAVLADLEGPITIDELTRQVLELWPSQARNPRAPIRDALRWDGGRRIVFLDDKTILPVRLALSGARFRITLSRQEAKRGAVQLMPGFYPFLIRQNWGLPDPAELPVRLLDERSEELPIRYVNLRQQVEGLLGSETVNLPAFDLSDWLKGHAPRRNDDLLVTVVDWKRGWFALAFEPAGRRRKAEMRQQNTALADTIYALLCDHRDERPFATEIIPAVYARLGDAVRAYPGDHWTAVIEADNRLGLVGYAQICLARYARLGLFDLGSREVEVAPPDSHQLDQIFRFKASLTHAKRIWRRIELRGSDTLGRLDTLMREAFEHDWDHLSEFSIKPKDRRHARWEGLGHHSPLGGESADKIQIAQLGLEAGDKLQYVYDFGDYIQHSITLEAIGVPDPGVEYPRIAGQNKPRYKDCESCKAQDIKRRATWICIQCSDREERAVLLCEECLVKEHEFHYADEILY